MKTYTREERNAFIIENWSKMSNQDICTELSISQSTLSVAARSLGLPRKASGPHMKRIDPVDAITFDREQHRAKADRTSGEKKYKTALGIIKDLEKEREVIYQTKDIFDSYTYSYKPLTKDTESVAVVLASDWHVEEEVKAQWTNGLNRYNLDIAESCAEQFFQNTVTLLKKESEATKIDTLVLALLGDFITNYLHDENVETCLLGPSEAVLFAQSLLSAGIEYLIRNTDVEIIVPCHVGNHSRISDKVHFSTEKANSLETIMYQNLAWRFKDEKRIRFILSESYVSYLDLGGYTIAFHHGHGIKFGGAIGGITTSVIKWIQKTELGKKADLYCFGHHHTSFDGRLFLANGSLIGYGSRALALGYGYEPRSQTFFLVNLKHKRKTVVCPILFTK